MGFSSFFCQIIAKNEEKPYHGNLRIRKWGRWIRPKTQTKNETESTHFVEIKFSLEFRQATLYIKYKNILTFFLSVSTLSSLNKKKFFVISLAKCIDERGQETCNVRRSFNFIGNFFSSGIFLRFFGNISFCFRDFFGDI